MRWLGGFAIQEQFVPGFDRHMLFILRGIETGYLSLAVKYTDRLALEVEGIETSFEQLGLGAFLINEDHVLLVYLIYLDIRFASDN
jgi:hypothetical protein